VRHRCIDMLVRVEVTDRQTSVRLGSVRDLQQQWEV
jgi:hypothetical protein